MSALASTWRVVVERVSPSGGPTNGSASTSVDTRLNSARHARATSLWRITTQPPFLHFSAWETAVPSTVQCRNEAHVSLLRS